MDGGDDGNLVIKKRFVTEAELDERRKRRQEEWEKVRKPEDPKGIYMGLQLAINITVLILTAGLQRRYQCPPFGVEERRLRGVKDSAAGSRGRLIMPLPFSLYPTVFRRFC